MFVLATGMVFHFWHPLHVLLAEMFLLLYLLLFFTAQYIIIVYTLLF
jgi:hypothetical protein